MNTQKKISAKEIRRILLKYNIGGLKKISHFKLGWVNTNLLLSTTKGRYSFKYYENRSRNWVRFEVNLLQYLRQHRYYCLSPIRNKNGNYMEIYGAKPFVLFDFVAGEHISNPNITRYNEQYNEVARAVAQLHVLTINYKPTYSGVRDTYDAVSCLRSAQSNVKKIKSKAEARVRLQWLKGELKKLEVPKLLVKGVCHCDLHFSNFLFESSKLKWVLDFDGASFIPLAYDLANLLYFWAWPHKKKLQFSKARKLLIAYNHYRKIYPLEKKHIYDLLKMVIFMSIGWNIHQDKDFATEKRKIESLNNIDREEFAQKLFNWF